MTKLSGGQPVTQSWLHTLPIMQQTVLLSAIRGCDGLAKRHKAKPLLKWFRRCILLSAFDGRALTDPFEPGGGSFTGPICALEDFKISGGTDPERQYFSFGRWVSEHDCRCSMLQKVSDDFIDSRDELHAHYQVHAMHAFEILGYKHPDADIREFWNGVYLRLVHAYHLWPETEEQLDARLGDTEEGWRARADISTSCSD